MRPDWLKFVGETPADQFPTVAVLVHHPQPDHCGVLFSVSQDEVRMLHLAWHKDLRNDPVADKPMQKYAWVSPNLSRERALALVAWCRRIWKRHEKRGLAYGLRFDATIFHQTGEVRWGTDEVGLTCATFVLAVFRAARIELLRLGDWPEPDEHDRARQRALVQSLRNDPQVPRDHCDALDREVGMVSRYRPVQVAGACSVSSWPCSFSEATSAANLVIDAFQSSASR